MTQARRRRRLAAALVAGRRTRRVHLAPGGFGQQRGAVDPDSVAADLVNLGRALVDGRRRARRRRPASTSRLERALGPVVVERAPLDLPVGDGAGDPRAAPTAGASSRPLQFTNAGIEELPPQRLPERDVAAQRQADRHAVAALVDRSVEPLARPR